MLSALLYLRLTSLQNFLRSRLRRLRQPKYLVGAIVGCAYFYFFFFRSVGANHGARQRIIGVGAAHAMPAAVLPTDTLAFATALGASIFLVILTLVWAVPTQRAALGFTEAEIAFLFPAPITRRALVHFRLLSSQFRSLAGAAVMMLFSNRWTFLGGNALTHAIGWWFIFSALNLHFSGANFTLTRLGDLGLAPWRRRLFAFLAVGAVIACAVLRLPVAERLPALGETFSLRPISAWLLTVTGAAPLSWLLWPLKLVLGPFFAADVRQFFLALAPALVVIAVHYLWVVNAAVSFEDSAIDQAQKRAARIAAWRSGNRRFSRAPAKGRSGPFPLATRGRPELAFLWKNLLSTWPYFTPRIFAISAFIIAAGCTWLNAQPAGRGLLAGVGIGALIFSGYTLLVGPQFARQDIRSDLANADILKTYPLAGWQIVLGELLTPTAILSGILWLAVLTIALTFHPGGTLHVAAGASGSPAPIPGSALAWLTPGVRLVAAVGLALVVPTVVALQLLVPSAAALLFPAWFQAVRTRGGGPEVVGQRMIFFFAQLLTIIIALLPAAAAAAALIVVLQWLAGPLLAVVVAAVAVAAILAGEVWLGVWWLGSRFEKLDLSTELRP
jgi:ABC-2 type transport system permease protein